MVNDSTITLRLPARPGLFQLSVVADASAFDWEELYFDLHDFGNDGVRTGPWDFDLRSGNKPLVPAYWTSLNGRRIGLWFFQRVSLQDIEAKRFRGRAAFWITPDDLDANDELELTFTPYRAMLIYWQTPVWECDPHDRLETDAAQRIIHTSLPADSWNDDNFWNEQQQKLAGTHTHYRDALQRAVNWISARENLRYEDIPLLVATYRLGLYPAGLKKALEVIDTTVALPHWGNPQEDGYSHNGDMGAANALWWLAWSLHALRDELGEERRQNIIAKLRLQGSRFMELALLNRDYWGGSVLQDHGWRSHFAFGSAVMHMLGFVPEAEKWLQYVIPRLQYALAAMPRDGVIPQSSYSSLFLHLEAVSHYREAHLALTGEDIYDNAPFPPIVPYVAKVLREEDHTMVLPGYAGGAITPYVGGNLFLNHMAAKYNDALAARLQNILLHTPPVGFHHQTQEYAFYNSALWGFFSYDSAIAPLPEKLSPSSCVHYEDSALIHYHDRENDITLALRCGPWIGWHADRSLCGPCDAMSGSPGAGHFILTRGNAALLTTPDAGYKLQSALCSCMLVDGRGQIGDVGYPMSIPSWQHPGHRIANFQWEEESGVGEVTLDLAPAYPQSHGIITYTRSFLLSPGHIICRDSVALRKPRPLSWLFQGHQDAIKLLEDEQAVFGNPSQVVLKPCSAFDLTTSLQKTPVVYGYSSASNFARFQHVRFDTVQPLQEATIDFIITPA